jgi:hypothetical protein
MISPYSSSINLTLDFYQQSANLANSHIQKIGNYLYKIEHKNFNYLINQANSKLSINLDCSLFDILKNQLKEVRLQSESDILEWIHEYSMIRNENTDFMKTYLTRSTKILDKLIYESHYYSSNIKL